MDDLRRFCVRMLGSGPAAEQAEREARAAGEGDRLSELAAVVDACRHGAPPDAPAGDAPAADSLAGAVAGEVRAATLRLTGPQREALALRELLALPYDELAAVMRIDADAVPALLARGRVALRSELRHRPEPRPDCPEYERALDTIARRQDGQPVSAADDDWLIEHLGHCPGCGRAHAAMLEASACYRAWNGEPAPVPER